MSTPMYARSPPGKAHTDGKVPSDTSLVVVLFLSVAQVRLDPGDVSMEDTYAQAGRCNLGEVSMLRSNWLYLAIGVVLVVFAYMTAAGYAAWSGLNLSNIAYVVAAIAFAIQVIIWIANAAKGGASQ
jgi:hypothetical protein